MFFNEFEEYKRQDDPSKKQKAQNWGIAIGLQKVDDLTPSKYLLEVAHKNFEGKIDIREVKEKINSYCKTEEGKKQNLETEQADKVSAHIAKFCQNHLLHFLP